MKLKDSGFIKFFQFISIVTIIFFLFSIFNFSILNKNGDSSLLVIIFFYLMLIIFILIGPLLSLKYVYWLIIYKENIYIENDIFFSKIYKIIEYKNITSVYVQNSFFWGVRVHIKQINKNAIIIPIYPLKIISGDVINLDFNEYDPPTKSFVLAHQIAKTISVMASLTYEGEHFH